jgi:sialic acid synthase SpsE
MTKLISEIGWNHMGDMERAKDMIHASKENGADLVKFQTWSVKRLKKGPWEEDGRLEIYKNAELTKDQHFELYEYSNKVGIDFFTSVFSVDDAKLLSEVQDKFVKIASFDSDNLDLLRYCNDNFETMFISTGTKTVDEVKGSVNKENIPDANVVVLHCVSSYPLKPKNANLPRINSFKKIYDNVGYSDHTVGVETTKVALEYDIDVVEKHFTLDQSLPGRDNKFAILPHELKDLSDYIKMREESKTSHGDGYLGVEEESRKWMTGRFNG